MMTPEDQKQRRIRGELLHRAVALGEELTSARASR
jgi:hypothetical protein